PNTVFPKVGLTEGTVPRTCTRGLVAPVQDFHIESIRVQVQLSLASGHLYATLRFALDRACVKVVARLSGVACYIASLPPAGHKLNLVVVTLGKVLVQSYFLDKPVLRARW